VVSIETRNDEAGFDYRKAVFLLEGELVTYPLNRYLATLGSLTNLVACPWPAEEDELRLANEVASLRCQLELDAETLTTP
jgi:hypothetical protein